MCGILGGNNTTWDYNGGINGLTHRGPDCKKICKYDGCTLAFARLAIIDLTDKGMQPMSSLDGKVTIVYNGEIYGYKDVRKQLEKKGYFFNSNSDTEVILNAYIEWGNKFVNKIDGMFGIAIYDTRDNTIRLFRDRIGIKPLYYYCQEKSFAFASELKGITQLCKDKKFDIDNTAIYDYLTYSYIPEPKTLYKNVYKLEPGHYMIYDLKSNKIQKKASYWKLKVNDTCHKSRNTKDLQYELRELIKNSVHKQMIADVPVGTFLSGGLDSSIITYETHLIDKNIKAFSIGFSEKKYDETKYAKIVSDSHGISLQNKVFTKDIFKEYYNQLQKWFDEPFADTSAFPTYLVSKLARENVTVVLTGDGGDEVFGGYPRYVQLAQKDKIGIDNLLVSSIVMLISQYHNFNDLYLFMDDFSFLKATYSESICVKDVELRKLLKIPKDYDKFWHMRKHYIRDLPPITRGQYLDLKTYLPGEVLTKVDRTSMANSLETRVPLLDKDIVEFSFGLSQDERCPKGELKGLLKQTYMEVLGKTIVNRRKQGFCMPNQYISKEKTPREEIIERLWGFNEYKFI